MSCKLAVFKVSWNPNPFVIFLNVLQKPKICSSCNLPTILPLLAATLLVFVLTMCH